MAGIWDLAPSSLQPQDLTQSPAPSRHPLDVYGMEGCLRGMAKGPGRAEVLVRAAQRQPQLHSESQGRRNHSASLPVNVSLGEDTLTGPGSSCRLCKQWSGARYEPPSSIPCPCSPGSPGGKTCHRSPGPPGDRKSWAGGWMHSPPTSEFQGDRDHQRPSPERAISGPFH